MSHFQFLSFSVAIYIYIALKWKVLHFWFNVCLFYSVSATCVGKIHLNNVMPFLVTFIFTCSWSWNEALHEFLKLFRLNTLV